MDVEEPEIVADTNTTIHPDQIQPGGDAMRTRWTMANLYHSFQSYTSLQRRQDSEEDERREMLEEPLLEDDDEHPQTE